jgi:predicted transposase YbfD/YdcC
MATPIAVPKLLRLLNLKGSIVSLDAMGAQRKIAIAIIQAGANYLLNRAAARRLLVSALKGVT